MWKVKKSKIHGTGVFASSDIKKNTRIIEYIGEKITKAEGDIRSEKRIKKYLNSKKTGSVYIFELNKNYDIDGSFLYNKARYINHSCDPNVSLSWVLENSGVPCIELTALRDIQRDEEICFSYINENMSYEERRAVLMDYGFVCDCEKCSHEED